MAEKKKMSVAEILAAARKADNKSASAESSADASSPSSTTADASLSADAAQPSTAASQTAAEPVEAASVKSTAEPTAEPAEPRAAKPAKPSGARPSVAEMLAIARAKKGSAESAPPKAAEAQAAAKAPVTKQAPAKEATAKPAAAKSAKETDPAAPKPIRDTASILAAARAGAKAGPVSKAEAAAKPAAKVATKPTKAAVAAKSKPAPARAPVRPAGFTKPTAAAEAPADDSRRGFFGRVYDIFFGSALAVGMTSLTATAGLWSLGTARYMFPNVLAEPPSRFKVGPPGNFAPGQVETKFVAQYGVWVVNGDYNGQSQIYALRTVCTHLGCTPNWLEGEQKFKCPCHGSGFYKDGINFEGPAPRPLERYAISIADDGQLEIDKSKMFQEEVGQWANPESFVPA